MYSEKSLSSIASFTVLKPAKKAIPQLKVWEPLSKRSFNSRNLFIFFAITISLFALAKDKIFFTFSLSDCIAQKEYTSAIIIRSSLKPNVFSMLDFSMPESLPGTILSTRELQK